MTHISFFMFKDKNNSLLERFLHRKDLESNFKISIKE